MGFKVRFKLDPAYLPIVIYYCTFVSRTAKYQRDYEHQAPVNDVTLHPNQGELVSCAQNGSIKIWDLTGDACTHELVPEEDVAVRSVSISSDGTMLVAANSQVRILMGCHDPNFKLTFRVIVLYGK